MNRRTFIQSAFAGIAAFFFAPPSRPLAKGGIVSVRPIRWFAPGPESLIPVKQPPVELLIYDRALTEAEIKSLASHMQNKYGTVEIDVAAMDPHQFHKSAAALKKWVSSEFP